MLFSKEMEGVGTLRFSLTDQRVVYCYKDLCYLLGLKPSFPDVKLQKVSSFGDFEAYLG